MKVILLSTAEFSVHSARLLHTVGKAVVIMLAELRIYWECWLMNKSSWYIVIPAVTEVYEQFRGLEVAPGQSICGSKHCDAQNLIGAYTGFMLINRCGDWWMCVAVFPIHSESSEARTVSYLYILRAQSKYIIAPPPVIPRLRNRVGNQVPFSIKGQCILDGLHISLWDFLCCILIPVLCKNRASCFLIYSISQVDFTSLPKQRPVGQTNRCPQD